jgi:peptidoglycan/xylan/chitin deacetylase (PgdA/CDA1 family)
MGEYAGRDDLLRAADAGHEIGCHTYSHLDCGNAAAALVEDDLDLNAALLSDWGIAQTLKTFAYPFGDVGFAAKQVVAERFSLSRGLHHGLIEPGADLNQAPAVGVEGDAGEALGHAWLAKAAERRAWVILFTHDIADTARRFGASADGLARLVDKALALGFDVVSAAEGAARVGSSALKPAAIAA